MLTRVITYDKYILTVNGLLNTASQLLMDAKRAVGVAPETSEESIEHRQASTETRDHHSFET